MKTHNPDIRKLQSYDSVILDNIREETIDVYLYIVDEFRRVNILTNNVFQFVYRSFYGLDRAGLTDEFKSEYFRLLESARDSVQVDIRDIVSRLYEYPNRRGKKALQFSFATKLLHTVNDQYPVYDSAVALMFDFNAPYSYKPFEKRLEEYTFFYNHLQNIYVEILASQVLEDLINGFRQRFPRQQAKISDVKTLDFIFWSAGKLKSNNWRLSGERAA
jgi:hypothetical protein